MNSNVKFLLVSIVAIAMCGCTSIQSTQLFRDADGRFIPYCLPRPAKGIPCKFKVETGICVTIHETIFVNRTFGTLVPTSRRLLAVKTKPVFTDQVFLVHIPRPIAGTLDMSDGNKGYSFNNDGYLTGIKARVDDTTIEDISDALGKNSLGGILTASPKDSLAAQVIEPHERMIAIREFSFADPNWHVDMNDWISQYQDCHVTCVPEDMNAAPIPPEVPRVAMLNP